MDDRHRSDAGWTTGRSPLADPAWSYVDKDSLDAFRAPDWTRLNRQRGPYYADQQARQALDLLTASRDAASFGYLISNYQHGLQTATMLMEAGHDDEDIVVALFHDIGFITCPGWHGEFAAALLGAHVSERNHWMLRRHTVIQQFDVIDHPDHNQSPEAEHAYRHERDKWRGHPHFDWAVEFVDTFDQRAISPTCRTAPIEVFEPMVHRIFARPPRPPSVD